jgi:hypothetical protein
VSNSNSAVLLLGLPKDFGSRLIAQDEPQEKHEMTDELGEKKTAKLAIEKAASDDFRRHRRQAAEAGVRECGIIDLVC